MSTHRLDITRKADGQTVEILIGWNRPQRGFWLVVEEKATERSVYCNLDDRALAATDGMARSLRHFRGVLADLGLPVPEAVLAEVQRDADRDVGNREVRWSADGRMLSDD